MRLRGRQIKLYYPLIAWSAGPRFLTRRTSLDLLQAAMVIEGYAAKIRFLGFEGLYPHPMSEWTTITIPYARISRVNYSRPAPGRVASWAALGLIGLAVIAAKGWLLVPVLALLMLVAHFAFPSRCVIVFELGDGGPSRIILRVRSKRERGEFRARLESCRSEARRQTSP